MKVPAEIEGLVLLGVQSGVYEKIGNDAKQTEVDGQYEVRFKKYVEGFINTRQSQVQEKTRIESSDINN